MQDNILIGPLPGPRNGQSVSFEMLVESLSTEAGVNVHVIDIAEADFFSKIKMFSKTFRTFGYIPPVLNFLRLAFSKNATVYLTIAQSRFGFLRDLIFISIASVFGRNIILHLKGGNYSNFFQNENTFFQIIIRFTLLKATKILVLSHLLTNMFDFEPKLKEKVFVVENGLPFEGPTINPVKNFDGPFRILYLSNLIQSKGYFDLLIAASLLKKNGLDIQVDFAGSFLTHNDDKKSISSQQAQLEFEAFVRDNSLENCVRFHGSVFGDSKLELLRKAHIFVLPTNYNNEGQPVSIIEALAFGVPIVSTNFRAIPDMLIDGVTGLFVEYKSPDGIVQAVTRLTDPEIHKEMSKNCVELYKEMFTRKAHLVRLCQHFITPNKSQSSTNG